jgi:serine/threonine protein kinase
MTSIFSNDIVEIKHKRVLYTIPKHIFLKIEPEKELSRTEYRGTFGLYTANVESFLDGAYSIVIKYEDITVKNKDNSRIALKVSSHTKANYNKIQQEFDIYNILRGQTDYSKYICACYGMEILKQGRKTFNYLTMEYLTCDLFDFIFKHRRPYSDKNIYSILLQTIKCLRFLHQNNIIYNDLKLENIMISGIKCNSETGDNSIKIKLIDFNCCTIMNSKVEIGGGTLEYMSPELQRCVNNNSFKTLTPKSDVWSVGLLACMLFLQCQPYEDTNGKLIITNIQMNVYNDINTCIQYINGLKERPSPSFIKSKSNENFIISIMDMCFKTDIDNRASIRDLLYLLEYL